MNAAHLHLAINHLPVVGLLFGLAVLIAGRLLRNETTARVGLWMLLAAALLAIPAYLTGEPAEEIVESLPAIPDALIERHEEAAGFALGGALIVGVMSGATLFLARGGRALHPIGCVLVLIAAVASTGCMAWTAKLGGEIHHPEIRAN